MDKLKPLKLISEDAIAQKGIFTFHEAKIQSPYSDKIFTWGLVTLSDSVIIIPKKENNTIILKREWRVAQKDFVWEFPGGGIDKDNPTEQDILDAANRELQEEIGYKAEKITYLTKFMLGNYVRGVYHIVLAENLSESQLDGDDDEFIDTESFSLEESIRKITEESIPTAQSLIALNFAKEISE